MISRAVLVPPIPEPGPPGREKGNWTTNPALASRMPLFFCLAYCAIYFYLKAAAHRVLDLPHVDDKYSSAYIPQALWLISSGLLPAMLILLIAPLGGFTTRTPTSVVQCRAVARASLTFSFGLAVMVVLQRGGAAFTDPYGNRLLIEHGFYAPLTILMTPFIISATVVLSLTEKANPGRFVAAICLVWGVFLAKGSMLEYPLVVYAVIRGIGRPRFAIISTAVLVAGLVAVVLLGTLRSGGDLNSISDDNGLRVLALFLLHRIDQLDSLALVLSQRHLEYSLSFWDETWKSLLYLLPRGLYQDKPLSFSMELTANLRPLVFEADAANNFTLFAQAFLIAGSLAGVMSFIIILLFFYLMACVQRTFFSGFHEFWAFNFAVVIPSFMSLIGSGLFREYVVFQLLLSIPGLLMFVVLFRKAGR